MHWTVQNLRCCMTKNVLPFFPSVDNTLRRILQGQTVWKFPHPQNSVTRPPLGTESCEVGDARWTAWAHCPRLDVVETRSHYHHLILLRLCYARVAPVVSDFLQPRMDWCPQFSFCPWRDSGKNAGVAATPPGDLPHSGIEPLISGSLVGRWVLYQ